MNRFVSKVEIVDGQMAFIINPEVFETLDLKDGQFLLWEVEDQRITITKRLTEEMND